MCCYSQAIFFSLLIKMQYTYISILPWFFMMTSILFIYIMSDNRNLSENKKPSCCKEGPCDFMIYVMENIHSVRKIFLNPKMRRSLSTTFHLRYFLKICNMFTNLHIKCAQPGDKHLTCWAFRLFLGCESVLWSWSWHECY